MLIWDNSRMLHRGMGCNAGERRTIHRTTIKGDYGHGHWENEGAVAAVTADVM